MKALFTIDLKEVNHIKIDDNYAKEHPEVKESIKPFLKNIQKVIEKLIKKYSNNKIKAEISYELL